MKAIDLVLDAPDASDPAEIETLAQWLRRDDQLRTTQISLMTAVPGDEEMGNALTAALSIVTENKETVSALIGGVATWIATRRKPTRIRVRRGTKEIEIVSRQIDDPVDLARELLRDLGK